MLINIYNPCVVNARADVLTEIADYWRKNAVPCLIIRDFNDVLRASETGRSTLPQFGCNNFKKNLQELQLLEIASSIVGFTWFRGNSKSIRDRMFVNPEWLPIFPFLNVTLLQRGLSDHCSLLMNSNLKN